ncbi:hypothetical protein AHiyo8_59030 [Arthrobacter sp. Hiyo8]|nr:hypothetical protein AHiyo8_59030 [Arthrobacter sp. Hiyo8]
MPCMSFSDLINRRFVVPILNVAYFGPTLAERTKKRDWGFNRTKKPTDK